MCPASFAKAYRLINIIICQYKRILFLQIEDQIMMKKYLKKEIGKLVDL